MAENENNRVVCKFFVMLAVIKKYQLGYFIQLLKSNSKELWTVHPSLYKADGLLAVRVCMRKRPIIFINVINSFSWDFSVILSLNERQNFFYKHGQLRRLGTCLWHKKSKLTNYLSFINRESRLCSFVNTASYVREVWTVHYHVTILRFLYVKNVTVSINIYTHYVKAVRCT